MSICRLIKLRGSNYTRQIICVSSYVFRIHFYFWIVWNYTLYYRKISKNNNNNNSHAHRKVESWSLTKQLSKWHSTFPFSLSAIFLSYHRQLLPLQVGTLTAEHWCYSTGNTIFLQIHRKIKKTSTQNLSHSEKWLQILDGVSVISLVLQLWGLATPQPLEAAEVS